MNNLSQLQEQLKGKHQGRHQRKHYEQLQGQHQERHQGQHQEHHQGQYQEQNQVYHQNNLITMDCDLIVISLVNGSFPYLLKITNLLRTSWGWCCAKLRFG